MIKIKTFTNCSDNEINNWIEENKPKIVDIKAYGLCNEGVSTHVKIITYKK